MNKELIGICGLYCGACDNYVAFQPSGKHLLETEKYKGKDLKPLKCLGCNSDALSEHCSKCEMMKCAKAKDYLHCGECDDFPCERINQFYGDGKRWKLAKHRLDILDNIEDRKAVGAEEWLKQSSRRWTCGCGQTYSYYEQFCSSCNKKLNSYY